MNKTSISGENPTALKQLNNLSPLANYDQEDDDTDCATPVSLGIPMNQDCKNMELAWNLVEWIVDRHKKLASSPKGSHLIETLAVDDMVFTAKKFIACQAEFQQHGIWPEVSLGFHYTRPANLEGIKQNGLITRAERCSDQTYARRRLTYGDGIYVANNPNAFHGRFGKIGIIVAIIKGKCERATSTGRKFSINANTVIGNKYRSRGSASANSNNYFDEIVLQESCQCLPLIKYDASLLNESIKLGAYFKELQRGVDKFLNNDLIAITAPFDTDRNMTNPVVSSGGVLGKQDLIPWPSNPFTTPPKSLTSSSFNTSFNNYTSLSLPMPFASLPIPAASLERGKNNVGGKNLPQSANIFATNTLNTTPISNINLDQKDRQNYFLKFTRVLMHYLENFDKEMHARAKFVIRDSADQKKQNNPAYASLSVSMQGRLRALVGEDYWVKVEGYLCQFLKRDYQTKDGMSPQSALISASRVAMIAASPLPGKWHPKWQYGMGTKGSNTTPTTKDASDKSNFNSSNPIDATAKAEEIANDLERQKKEMGLFAMMANSTTVGEFGTTSHDCEAATTTSDDDAARRKKEMNSFAAFDTGGTNTTTNFSKTKHYTGSRGNNNSSSPNNAVMTVEIANDLEQRKKGMGLFSNMANSGAMFHTSPDDSADRHTSRGSGSSPDRSTRSAATNDGDATWIASLTRENHQPQQEHIFNRAQQIPQIPHVTLKQQFLRQPESQKRKTDTLAAIVKSKRHAGLADIIPNTVTRKVVATIRMCQYNAPESFNDSTKENVFSEVAIIEQKSKELCVICLEEMKYGEKIVSFNIDSCNHTFHRGCIESALRRMPRCPICRKYVKEPQGYSPSGTLTITVAESTCSGFEHESTRTFVLNYVMPENTQKSYHPNPGVRYTRTIRKAYIPDVLDGRKLLQRLLYAFEKGLLFLIGTSGTTGRQNVIIWSSVHQKTQQFGGAMNHGFPDPGYFINCNDELDALGVPTDPHIDTVSL